ncbi:MAG: sigma-54 dependent transcriptional regulator [Planctomycetota bacterium]
MTASASATRILVVDDDRIILESLGELLRLEGFHVQSVPSFADAVRALDRDSFELILSDVTLPGGSGFELLHVVRRRCPETVMVMITGYGTIESAVEAIRLGAYDYLTKPIIDEELKVCIERALSQQAILKENRVLKERLDVRFGLQSVVGHDYRMLKVFDLVESVAASSVTVLLQGPSGTGKSMIAKVVHQLSSRADKPFVEVSCGAIPETLLESELFGHVRGAFTGAVANKPGKFKASHGGTIFLDEISSASPGLQVKLLRVLQTRQFEPVGSNKTDTVDVRVVLASNMDLEAEMKAGRFREDLYYRINVVSVDLPSLSERVGDVPLLAKHFLNRFAAELKRPVYEFNEETLHALQRYRWPGNVRELENVVERAVVLCKGRSIALSDLPEKLVREAAVAPPVQAYRPMPLRDALEEPERRIIEAALRANDWNRQLTAEQLQINRTTLYKKMKRYGLDRRPNRIPTR